MALEKLLAVWMGIIMNIAASNAPDTGKAATLAIPSTRQFTLTASANGRRYRIFVAYPRDEAPREGYPVIYLLDGNATFLIGAEAVRLQTRKPKGFEPAVLVAVGYETDEPFDVVRRYFDYTTPASPSDLPPRRIDEPWPELGGADAFLDFIEKDLKPEIELRLPINRDRQTLFGHSLGGFFTLYTLFTRPHLFSSYVAGSPSIWWNKGELLDRAGTLAGNAPDLRGKRLLIGIGGDELDDMLADSRRMAALLPSLVARGLEFQYAEFAGEEHMTVLPALVSRTIGFSLVHREGARR